MKVDNKINTRQENLDETLSVAWPSRLEELSASELKRVVSYMDKSIKEIEERKGCRVDDVYKELLEALGKYAKAREKYDIFVKPVEQLLQLKQMYNSLPDIIKKKLYSNITKLEKDINRLMERTGEYIKAKIDSENKLYSIISKHPEVQEYLDIVIAQIATDDVLYVLSRDIIALSSMRTKLNEMDRDAKSNILQSILEIELKKSLSLYIDFSQIYNLLEAYYTYRLLQRCKPSR